MAKAAEQNADLARGLIGNVSTPMVRGELIRMARRNRLAGLAPTDHAVLAELADGATWEEVADALCLDVDAARRIYEPTWQEWRDATPEEAADLGDFGIGLNGDPDLEGTAATIDQWWRRHAEPWETVDENPVSRLLVDGETPARDR